MAQIRKICKVNQQVKNQLLIDSTGVKKECQAKKNQASFHKRTLEKLRN